MADPITWGLINLVKKGVKGVQTTLDGVSDKVNGLPDSFDADFTEVKNAISEVDSKIDSLSSVLSNMQYVISNTNAVVQDIYLGNQYSEWIKDLESNGTSSSTYIDSSKMNTLITYEPAVMSSSIDNYLLRYIIDNNKNAGSFFKIKLQDKTSNIWESLSTFDSICKNNYAYNILANDSTSFTLVIEEGLFPTIYSNCSVTRNITKSSSVAKNILISKCEEKNESFGEDRKIEAIGFVNTVRSNSGTNLTLTYCDGSTQQIYCYSNGNVVNDFLKEIKDDSGINYSAIYKIFY